MADQPEADIQQPDQAETPEAVPVQEAEASAENPRLNPSDTEADSDLSRPARAAQFRVQRRSLISTAIPAVLLMTLGIIYLIQMLQPDALSMGRPVAIGVAAGTLGLSLALRFLLNGRRERGLFFVALVILFWLGLTGAAIGGLLTLEQTWPLAISVVGVAMIVTYIFERGHDRGLLMPGLIVILLGALALPFTMGLVPADVMSLVALYWPAVLIVLAMALLPRAVRERSR